MCPPPAWLMPHSCLAHASTVSADCDDQSDGLVPDDTPAYSDVPDRDARNSTALYILAPTLHSLPTGVLSESRSRGAVPVAAAQRLGAVAAADDPGPAAPPPRPRLRRVRHRGRCRAVVAGGVGAAAGLVPGPAGDAGRGRGTKASAAALCGESGRLRLGDSVWRAAALSPCYRCCCAQWRSVPVPWWRWAERAPAASRCSAGSVCSAEHRGGGFPVSTVQRRSAVSSAISGARRGQQRSFYASQQAGGRSAGQWGCNQHRVGGPEGC